MFADLLKILSEKPTLAGSVITAIIAALVSAVIQYFSQKRLKNREAQTSEALKRLELELKRQGDRVQTEFQTQFSAAHKARDEMAAIFLDNMLQAERALAEYFRKDEQGALAGLAKNQEAMDYQRARAEIYFPENISTEFGVIVLLISATRRNIWMLKFDEDEAERDKRRETIRKHLYDALPKERKKLGEKLKAVLLPTNPSS